MFRKLVSNLPFSPALVGQLGFYARRLRKEQVTRRVGLIFTAMAVVIQSFAVFSPPEQALASSGSDIVKGGVSSVRDILNTYDQGADGKNDFKDIMDYIGITRAELASLSSQVVYVCSSDHSIISFGRQHHYSAAEGELSHRVPRQTGGFSTLYSVPLHRFDSVNNRVNCYDSYVGHSKKVGWFAIMRKCGNVQIKRNVQKFPQGHFITATCRTVQGYAYDERQLDLRVKVYLFFGGPPGQGKQYGPINANRESPSSPAGSGYGFSFTVPDEYQKKTSETAVWAVLKPLPGWNQSTVQFNNTVAIPGNCTPPAQPSAACDLLTVNRIERTRISLTANARTEEGAEVTGYTYGITDKSSDNVYSVTVKNNALSDTSAAIDLPDPGDYIAKVVVHTTVGDRESADCTKPLSISPPDKCPYSPSIGQDDADCRPCPYDEKIWIRDEDCGPNISESKEARNLTQELANANGTTARPGDRIEFTIYTTNVSNVETTTNIDENLHDILEYAELTHPGGGTFNAETKTLTWGETKLDGQQTDKRQFAIQVKDTIPATPRGANDPATYDCVMTNSYGNTIGINVQCPVEKTIETTVKQLPSTGTTTNVIFGSALLMVATYFYARSRQINKEVRLIRKDFNTGTL